MDEFNLIVQFDPECEHCGTLEHYDVMFESGTTWCLDCAQYDYDFKEHITEEQIKDAKIESFKKKLKYHESEISYCNTQLRKLVNE